MSAFSTDNIRACSKNALMRRCYAQADPFRRRSLLAVLLGCPFAGELTAEAEDALASGDSELAAAALTADEVAVGRGGDA